MDPTNLNPNDLTQPDLTLPTQPYVPTWPNQPDRTNLTNWTLAAQSNMTKTVRQSQQDERNKIWPTKPTGPIQPNRLTFSLILGGLLLTGKYPSYLTQCSHYCILTPKLIILTFVKLQPDLELNWTNLNWSELELTLFSNVTRRTRTRTTRIPT